MKSKSNIFVILSYEKVLLYLTRYLKIYYNGPPYPDLSLQIAFPDRFINNLLSEAPELYGAIADPAVDF